PIVSLQVVPGYEVRLAKPAAEITPGAKVEIAGTIRREPTFEGGMIRVEPDDLPEQVKCPAVEVPADKTEFTLVCEASASAKPGTFPIRIASTAPNTGRKSKQDYKGPDLNAKIVITGAAQAAR